MPKVWKIAPGSQARAWPECQEGRCILFGWRELGDHSRFENEMAVRKAMKKAYKRGEPGTGRGAAQSVWRFANEVQPKDIVVANCGRSSAVGIGIIQSDYLPPGAAKNPSKHEWLHSARLVDWRITEQVNLRPYLFVQDTVWPLEHSQCEEIKRAYLKANPKLRKKFDELFGNVEPHVNLDASGPDKAFAGDSDIEGLRSEYHATRTKRSRRLRNKAFHLAKGICAVCRRDFSTLLGGRGKRVLQVHHREQLSARYSPAVTKLTDLAVVCANCHLLLHMDSGKAMHVDQLRNLLKDNGYLEG
jgi:hypothetical protein